MASTTELFDIVFKLDANAVEEHRIRIKNGQKIYTESDIEKLIKNKLPKTIEIDKIEFDKKAGDIELILYDSPNAGNINDSVNQLRISSKEGLIYNIPVGWKNTMRSFRINMKENFNNIEKKDNYDYLYLLLILLAVFIFFKLYKK